MWLEAKRTWSLVDYQPDSVVVPWRIDVFALTGEENPEPGRDNFLVGRLMADELRVGDIEERGGNVWDAADNDSSGLEAAWASLLDEAGSFRSEDFESSGDPVVYLYRFELHPDFAAWRMPVMHSFCRAFPDEAIILAQYHTTWFSQAEFEQLGFELLPPTCYEVDPGFPAIDRDTRFMARENCLRSKFGFSDYPEEPPPAKQAHADWLKTRGPWRDLV